MPHGFSVGSLVCPGDFFFPDFERLGLHRNSVGLVTEVAADGRVTVNWSQKGHGQIGIYTPDQLTPAPMV